MADDILAVNGQQPKYERHLRVRPRRSRAVIAVATEKLCPGRLILRRARLDGKSAGHSRLRRLRRRANS